ncbi:MAG: aconitate hydratase AcnA, partial [Bifidobacteriaceae bacterium]|nr:aconitate hydratase AcnA [Bifidobacteriaceae bacterium]
MGGGMGGGRRSVDSFGARGMLRVRGRDLQIYRLEALGVDRLPYCLRVLAENLVRHEDGVTITADHIRALATWNPDAPGEVEIQFAPGRVLMQDFTGVPCVVDLATMREAVARLGGDPERINPLVPAEMVIDHSVIVDAAGAPGALAHNIDMEYRRNRERYQFLRWGQGTFDNFAVVPPGTGIVHQVNIEHLARGVMTATEPGGPTVAYPDTCVGTDSHTTMVGGLGVLGWGVGGIEAEAAMLGQPVSMLVPRVVGFRLSGTLSGDATATDMVLTIAEALRAHGVVGKFVEFYGPGVATLGLADRATISNMSPEFGSTCAIFPIDQTTLDYYRLTGRDTDHLALIEAYAKEQNLWAEASASSGTEPIYSEYLDLDLGTVVPSIAGPKRPQDRIPLTRARETFARDLPAFAPDVAAADEAELESFPASDSPATGEGEGRHRRCEVILSDGTVARLGHGTAVIAAITSCTNTSNPSVMIAAGLLARRAVEVGLATKPWVKTSLAPGSTVVAEYYRRAGLTGALDRLGFHVVGYGCTTCIGNSGPIAPEISAAVHDGGMVAAAVLSGNRNFEGRINPDVAMNYLASPPLVVAYALAGTVDFDMAAQPLGHGADGAPIFLRDIWPSPAEVAAAVREAITPDMFADAYADVFTGDRRWRDLPIPAGATFSWDPGSTYVRRPPYFDTMGPVPEPVRDIHGARVLALLGDSVTTDHISPAGAIAADSPAGRYLAEAGIDRSDFNSYGSRRGNHEVMVRGTFANIRLRNRLVAIAGGYTLNQLTGEVEAIFDAAAAYREARVPLVVMGGREYGSGSSRDWAAKGTSLLGVRAVLAQSFERIHRSNLVGMGVAPLQFPDGLGADALGLDGTEVIDIEGLAAFGFGGPGADVGPEPGPIP